MKKLFSLVAAVFIAALSFAYPIKVNAAYSAGNGYYLESHPHFADVTNNQYYFYFCYNNPAFCKDLLFIVDKNNCNCTLDGTLLTITFNTSFGGKYYRLKYGSTYSGTLTTDYDTITYDYSTYILSVYLNGESKDPYSMGRAPIWTTEAQNYRDGKVFDYLINEPTFQTNWEEPNPLDISVSFVPNMNGAVSRQQTINGHSYTSDTCDMHIHNNGNHAQYAWFIVPTGDSVTFPEQIFDDSNLFYGNPVYAYISDEYWSNNIGFSGMDFTIEYSLKPHAWHNLEPMAEGEEDVISVPWSCMKLQANTSYDCVVYGALNDSVRHGVKYDYDTITEVYRSTFTISDPAEFDPNNNTNGVYPWDNDIDNHDLLGQTFAKMDNDGNITYVNHGTSTINGNLSNYSGLSTTLNPNQAFGTFFSFFLSVLSFFPTEYTVLIFIGISSIVVIAIIKAVSS